ncbi:RlpA-like double-psi beta-barrel-protein domain-containing protein-containing protein [Rhizoctonia solani]|nr:RlpA-like double-psi beta-barrel-protein domain-containing protein-containing protein [Rhizoctonia solani]
MFAFSTLAVAASLAVAVIADHGHGPLARSHHHVGRSNLQKRFSGTATYYLTGMGACGQYSNPGDFIVALNSAQYGGGYPGPNCFKPITICAKGKCVGATIMDECPTCGYGSLDLSEGLFTQFANTGDGVFQMTWTFADGNDEPKPTTTKKPDPPAPTTTWKPEPTTTWKPEPTTTWKPEPTTTWEEPTTTSSKKKTSTWSPPPETTSTPEPTTSSTSSTPTTTSTSTSTSTSMSSSSSIASVATASAVTSTSAAPSASASSGSTTGSGNNSGSGSGSNLVEAQQVLLAFGRLVTAAKGQ